MLIDVISSIFLTNLVVTTFGQYANTPSYTPSRIVFEESDNYDDGDRDSSSSNNKNSHSALLLQMQKSIEKNYDAQETEQGNSYDNIKQSQNYAYFPQNHGINPVSPVLNSHLDTVAGHNSYFQATRMRENHNDRLYKPNEGAQGKPSNRVTNQTQIPFDMMYHNTVDSNAKQRVTFSSPLSASITAIGLDLLKVLDSSDSGNIAISPFSISMALGLLQQGALGESQKQISNLMRLQPDNSLIQFRNLISGLRKRTSRNILSVATTIFVNFHFPINPQFKQMAIKNFASEVEPLDFENSIQSSNHINNWIRMRTNDKIKELVSPDVLGPTTQLLIANAIYFKGLWNSTFNKEMTIARPFNLENGATKETMFMQQLGRFQTGFDTQLNAQYLVLNFEGLQYAMVFIVPEQQTVSNLLENIQNQNLLNIMSSPMRESTITIPKFDLKFDADLTNALMRLGVVDLFSGKSSLQALSSSGSAPRVSGVLHGAALSIDEQGGRAAAASTVAVNTLSLADWNEDFHFRADRAFLLLLWDIEATLPLIFAKITDPILPK